MLELLSQQDQALIFNRFWRKDSARETGRHAVIGLALVKSYAGLMELELKTSIDENSRFNIRLSNFRIA
jgi:signal transduction histidine kinase